MLRKRDDAPALRGRAGARDRGRSALLGGTVLAGGILALIGAPQGARAIPLACAITSDPNTVTCAVSVTTTQTTNTDAASTNSSARTQSFTQFGAVTGSVGNGVTVNGFGLWITNSQSGSNGNVTFTNNGTVKADDASADAALVVQSTNGSPGLLTVTNTGTLTGHSGSGDGLFVGSNGSAASISVNNTGTISGGATGIDAVAALGTATVDITNSGTGSVSSTGSIAAINGRVQDGNGTVTVSGGTVSGEVGIVMSTNGGSGTAKVSVSGGAVSATASNQPIAIGVNSNGSGGVVAEVTGGTVTATGSLGSGGVGIFADTSGGSGTATVTVTGGSVTATGTGATAIFISTSSGAATATVTIGANASVTASGGIANGLRVSTGGGVVSATVLGTLSATGTGANAAWFDNASTLTVGNGGTSGMLVGNVLLNDAGARLIFNRSDTVSYGGAIHGTGAVVKTGAGTLVLSGSSGYSGGTTIQQGILQVTNNSSVGNGNVKLDGGTFQAGADGLSFVNTFSITPNNGTVDTNGNTLTLSNTISDSGGAGALTKTGAGILVLQGTNGYSGGTLVNGGLVNFNSAGNFGSGPITLDGGGLQWAPGNTADMSGLIAPIGAGGATFDTNGNNVTFAKGLGGTGGMTKAGAGTLTLGAGTNYAGATAVNGGTLRAGAANVFSAGSAFTVAGGAVLDVGGFDQAIGSLAGAGTVTNSGGSATLTAGDNTSTTFSGVIENGNGGGTTALTKTGFGTLTLTGLNSYSGGTTVDGGTLQIGTNATQAAIVGALSASGGGSTVDFVNADLSGMTTIALDTFAIAHFRNSTSASNVAMTASNFGVFFFHDSSTAGNATITINQGIPQFLDNSTAGNATITINQGIPQFLDNSTAGNATITVNQGIPQFRDNSTAGNANITVNAGIPQFMGNSTGGNASITMNGGILQFLGNSTAGNAAITVNHGILEFLDNSTGGNATLVNSSSADFGLGTGPNGDGKLSIGSIAGGGIFSLGANELTVGGNNFDTSVSGAIGSDGGSLVKVGTGTLTLTGNDTYSGPTTVNAGALFVNGALTTSNVTVNNGGTFGGSGNVRNVTINNGGNLVPGSAIATPGTLNVTGTLTLASGANYVVFITPSTTAKTSVTGPASLNGTVFANFLPNTRYTAGKYTILTATGGVSGTFASLNTLGLGSGSGVRNPHLAYDANDAFLVLDPGTLTITGGTGNSNAVGNSINNVITTGGNVPPNFQPLLNLTGSQLNAALNTLTGESNTGAQGAAAQLMTDYFNAVFNQMLGVGGGTPGGAGGIGATGFAPERVAIPDDVAMAYASILKAPPKAPAEKLGWGVWGSGFGGYNKTNGDPVGTGSGNLSARAYGFAAGLDYRFARGTTLGVSLAGSGTNWSVAGSGNGSSDAVQASLYGVHHWGPAYVAGAVAFTNHWMTTDRFAFAGDHLRAKFDAQSYGGRLEGGYRYAFAMAGVTPYAALQSQRFHTPGYTEADLTGGGFALTFNSRSSTDTRSELGARVDTRWGAPGTPTWILGGRLAWAHDWVSNPSLNAVFQTLPGAGFTVNGAAPTHNAALASVGSEMRFANGVALLAKFDSELSNRSKTYAGTGAVAYRW